MTLAPLIYAGQSEARTKRERSKRSQVQEKFAVISRILVFVLWVVISLLAISLTAEHPYWALTVALTGGIYLGWEASQS
ncbi:MAG: hypothetical protein HY645_11245 [Acidobacteria bacterium]|nr:hypothetical protein [Acidobacteriota bacterium]